MKRRGGGRGRRMWGELAQRWHVSTTSLSSPSYGPGSSATACFLHSLGISLTWCPGKPLSSPSADPQLTSYPFLFCLIHSKYVPTPEHHGLGVTQRKDCQLLFHIRLGQGKENYIFVKEREGGRERGVSIDHLHMAGFMLVLYKHHLT